MLCNNPGGGWLEGSIGPTVQGNQGFSLWGLARCSASYTCKISSVIISHVPRPLCLLVLTRTIERTYYTIRFFFSASNLLLSTTRGITSSGPSEQTVCAPQDRCEIATSDYTATGARVFVFAPAQHWQKKKTQNATFELFSLHGHVNLRSHSHAVGGWWWRGTSLT